MSILDPNPPGPTAGDDFSVHDERLSAILDDPTIPDRDKRQAIQEALEDLQRERGEEPAASYEPLEQRFFEALSLLADGGHDYDEISPPGDDRIDRSR